MLPATLKKLKDFVVVMQIRRTMQNSVYLTGYVEGQLALARDILRMEGFEEEKEKKQ